MKENKKSLCYLCSVINCKVRAHGIVEYCSLYHHKENDKNEHRLEQFT